MEYENFNAASASVTVTGRSTHTGAAKNTMRNAVLMAMEFQSMLPQAEAPMYTEGYEGFYHLDSISGDVEKCTMNYIIRDHDREKFQTRKDRFTAIGRYLNEKYGGPLFETKVWDTYYNMKEIILPHMEIVDRVKEAMEDLEIDPVVTPIRGGTDGAMLSHMGLPCPNLCTGGCICHSRYEFASVPHMRKIVKLLVKVLEKHVS
jgi:tripeptide aminopeptidase